MRRIATAAVSALVTVGLTAVVLPTAAHAAPAPTKDLKGTTVHRDLFGMHVFELQDGKWPTVPVGSIRLWDNATTWGQTETAQDVFDWKNLDTAVGTAEKNGVDDILMVLAGTPRWATDNPSSGGLAGVIPGAAGMPRDIADWDDWVKHVVTRYKGRITAYQPWNEANLTTFSTGTAKQMAQLTKHAYDIIKSVDPEATVVAPSTGTRLSGPFKKFYPAYLAELKSLGWPVDAWSAHTYPASLGTPLDRAKLASGYLAVLRAAGAPDLPVWDTENNFGLAGPGPQNPDQDINGQRAASWTARTYLDALRLGISRVYWYSWSPYPGDLDLLGIQMKDGSPAAVAYKTLQEWIVGATFNGCKGGGTVTCTFTKDGAKSKIVWAEAGKTVVRTRGFTQVCSLNGTCKAATGRVRVAGPVQLRR
jgi:polysaccharide biosynthesis protein PslG